LFLTQHFEAGPKQSVCTNASFFYLQLRKIIGLWQNVRMMVTVTTISKNGVNLTRVSAEPLTVAETVTIR
jgi:hypothetical protein